MRVLALLLAGAGLAHQSSAQHKDSVSGVLCDSTTCGAPLFGTSQDPGDCFNTFAPSNKLQCCLSASACNTCCFPDCYPLADVVFLLDVSTSINNDEVGGSVDNVVRLRKFAAEFVRTVDPDDHAGGA